MKSTQFYIKNYAKFLFAGLILVASFNFVADPRKFFTAVDIEGFNSEKPFINSGGLRKLKAIEIEAGSYDTIILGTSRVLHGWNPENPAFNSSQVYNAGLAGTSIYEISRVFEFANNNLDLNQVIIGLDAISFYSKKKSGGDYHESKFYKSYNEITFLLNELFSKNKFFESLLTINFNLENKDDEYISKGFLEIIDSQKDSRRKIFNDTIKEYLFREDLYPGLYDDPEQLNYVKKIFNQRKNHTKLYLFISPIHAYQLEGMKSINSFSKFEQFKRDLVKIVAEDAKINPNKQPIALWDFSGYNSITTEEIPPGDSKKQMKWYWESSHYKKELGDVLFDKMLNYPEKAKSVPKDFGVMINSSNIESHLERIRAEQALYKQNFPEDVQEVERLARETAHLRKASKTD